MSTRTYRVTVSVSSTLEVDEIVLERALSAAWQRAFYALSDARAVAAHLANAMLVRNSLEPRSLSDIDGFADLPDGAVRVSGTYCEDVDVDEVKPPPSKAKR